MNIDFLGDLEKEVPPKISFEVVSINRPTNHGGCQWSFSASFSSAAKAAFVGCKIYRQL